VTLEEAIQILADIAFVNNWLSETHHLNLSKMDLADLLKASTKDQLFSLMDNFMNRPMASPWALHSGHCSFFVYVRENNTTYQTHCKNFSKLFKLRAYVSALVPTEFLVLVQFHSCCYNPIGTLKQSFIF